MQHSACGPERALRVSRGEIRIVDEFGYPAIRRVCEFVLTNRNHRTVEKVDRANRRRTRAGSIA